MNYPFCKCGRMMAPTSKQCHTCFVKNNRHKKAERNFEMLCAYLDGATIKDLCDKHKVTYERAKQILRDAGGPGVFKMLGMNVSNRHPLE